MVVDVVVDKDGVVDREQEVFEQAHAPHLLLTVRLALTLSCVPMRVVHVHDHVDVHDKVRATGVEPLGMASSDSFTHSEGTAPRQRSDLPIPPAGS